MIIHYRAEPDAFFSMLDYCLRKDISVADFRCHRPWKLKSSAPELFSCAETESDYGMEVIDIAAKPEESKELARELARCVPGAAEDLLYAFLSEQPIETNAIVHARRALGGDIALLNDETDPNSRAILRAARHVRKEIFAFQGLLRFEEELDGRFVARFEPDFDISRALYPFFDARFGSTAFSIVDERRSLRLDSDSGVNADSAPSNPGENRYWKDLWKVFYGSTENPLRANPRLRLQHMPKRYWKHLPEVENDL